MVNIDKPLIHAALLEILADGIVRSTEQVLAEFSAEYPEYFQAVTMEWVRQNGYNCGALNHPLTVVSSALEDLEARGDLTKKIKGRKLWKINLEVWGHT